MFICNLSLNKSKLKKIIIWILAAVVILSIIFGIYTLANSSKANFVNDDIKTSDVTEISANNYTNILKTCHENIDAYLGKKIKFTGFVYRLYDFNENQFVLGREMIVSRVSDTQAQTVVVGFLCDLDNSSTYTDGTWVEIEGTIIKQIVQKILMFIRLILVMLKLKIFKSPVIIKYSKNVHFYYILL